jgi:hypothetical protein
MAKLFYNFNTIVWEVKGYFESLQEVKPQEAFNAAFRRKIMADNLKIFNFGKIGDASIFSPPLPAGRRQGRWMGEWFVDALRNSKAAQAVVKQIRKGRERRKGKRPEIGNRGRSPKGHPAAVRLYAQDAGGNLISYRSN